MDPATLGLTVRRALCALALAFGLLLPASVTPGPGTATACAAATTHRVAVVVQHADGTTLSRCTSFTGSSIRAVDALDGSGIPWRSSNGFGGLGLAVCQVDGEPATYDPSNCLKGGQLFWAIFVARGGGPWLASSQGISSLSLADGDSLGLRYQPQVIDLLPPTIRGDCPDPTPAPATPRPTVRPTPRPTPRPTATGHPTGGPAPSAASGVPTSVPGSPATASVGPSVEPTDGGVVIASAPPSTAPAGPVAPATGGPPSASATAAVRLAATDASDGPAGVLLAGIAAIAFVVLGALNLRRQR